jgi:hypothetical protein
VLHPTSASPTLLPLATGTTPALADGASCPAAPSPFLNAADDDFAGTPVSTIGGITGSVFGNDTHNTAVFAATDITPTVQSEVD